MTPGHLLVLAIPVVVLGLPIGLYALLTRGRRRVMREIRMGAADRGWRYRRQRWQGNPSAFRIDGQTASGQNWIVTCGNTETSNRGWVVQLVLRFPSLGGVTDLAIWTREGEFSGRFAGLDAAAMGFAGTPREVPSGHADFDAAYRILVRPDRAERIGIDAALAGRLLRWPAPAMTPHSMLAWRNRYAFEIQARLRENPDWATVSCFIALGSDLTVGLPPPENPTAPPGFAERLVGGLPR